MRLPSGLTAMLFALPPLAAARPTPIAHRPIQAATSYAVIVHPSTPVTGVTLAQLRQLFLGEQPTWPSGGRVVLFVQAPGAPGAADGARTVALRTLYQMDEAAFKRYWIDKTFRDEVAAGPKIVGGPAMARRLTATVPGAVALIPASEVDGTVKVLRVDGRLPGDAGYPLTDP